MNKIITVGEIELTTVMRENWSARNCRLGLNARKFSSAKISTFTVFSINLMKLPLAGLQHHHTRQVLSDKYILLDIDIQNIMIHEG